jgi:hypothetical protein
MAPHEMSRSDDFGGGATDQLDPNFASTKCYWCCSFLES